MERPEAPKDEGLSLSPAGSWRLIRAALVDCRNFGGEASAMEFWLVLGFAIGVVATAFAVDLLLGTQMQTPDGDVYGGILAYLAAICLVTPVASALTRRLRTLRRSIGG